MRSKEWTVVYHGTGNHDGRKDISGSIKRMTIGEKIAKLRKEKHITQTELADYLFLVPQTISKWEVGNGTPEVSLLPKIASFFDVSIDELFSISSMERTRDMVMKYSVLRDDNSFREAMDCLRSQIQTVDAALENRMGDREELEKQKTEFESLQMHLLLQQSRESAQRALEISDHLVQKTQEMPYILQRLQLRFMLGYGRQELQECENTFRKSPSTDTLQIYFEMLDNVQYYEKILELCHSDDAIITLMEPPSGENMKLWEQCVNAAKEMKDIELTEKYGEYIVKYGTPGARYRLLWSLAVLYKEKHMDEKFLVAKEQLFALLGELAVDSYWYERNRTAIEQL